MGTSENFFPEFAGKMRKAGLGDLAIRAFKHSYENLISGQTGLIPENNIQPVTDLPRFDQLTISASVDRSLILQTVVVKLNGGLGTSMGLERAKSLLPVKDGLTFLDFIVNQIRHLRREQGVSLRFLLMNSQNTSHDTCQFLRKYPELGDPGLFELMQSIVPKVDAKTLQPGLSPENPQLEWCPPGHGDLYPSLLSSGWLDRLLAEEIKYLFVSNSDNLGASLDPTLLSYFATSDKPFLMEVAERTASDRKGGHLAQRASGRFLLRESAQCPKANLPEFQDIERHRFFNTNNLWVRLDRLKELLDKHGGFLPLPLIRNVKTLDPRLKASSPVFQLETAMGAAIECFEDAGAIVVPRTRFAPVKTTCDLLALRSDAYEVTREWRIELAQGGKTQPPAIDLDVDHYKLVEQLDEKLSNGVPSLKACRELIVRGPVLFSSRNVFQGKVTLTNRSAEPRLLPPGEYRDCSKEL
jgi:UDP-N-acetylglucosamine pyrophosphorylase